tara:strand:+ start:33256 stop:34251 length:996 start_codon:yes stop_codon:yes gene_type:complete
MYKYDISNICKPFKQEDILEGRLNLCIYYANTSLSTIFIEYLLYKYNEGPLKDHMIIPFIEYTKKHSLENQLRIFFSKVFNESIEGESINIKGLYNGTYLFIDISSYMQTYKESLGLFKSYADCWWLATLYEIINTKQIFDIVIHDSVTDLFIKNPSLTKIVYNNVPVENPIIVYNGYSYNRCLFVSIFGKNKSFSNAYYGNYYYFTDFKGAIHYGNKTNTGKKISIGIVRSVLFTKKKYVVLNNPKDKASDLSIFPQLSSKEQKLYSKIYNPYGEWGLSYDTLFVYKPILQNGSTLDKDLNIVSTSNESNNVLNWIELDLSRKSISSVLK